MNGGLTYYKPEEKLDAAIYIYFYLSILYMWNYESGIFPQTTKRMPFFTPRESI